MMSLRAVEMKNDVLPSLPSQLYVFGSENEVQMQSSDFAFINNRVNLFENEFLCGSRLLNNVAVGNYDIPQSIIGYSQGTSSSAFSYATRRPDYLFSMVDNSHKPFPNYDVSSLLDSQNYPMVSTFGQVNSHMNAKRKVKRYDFPTENSEDILRNKRGNMHGTQNESLRESPSPRMQVPAAKRSQKLSDKITVLQKLVSPYGKTDTASVLHEAAIYIKHLHDKVSNMYEKLSSPHLNAATSTPEQDILSGDTPAAFDLRQRGLCLMPMSMSRGLTSNNITDDHARTTSRRNHFFMGRP